MSGEWTAYCAPGRKPVAELLALMRPEHVTEVMEHPWLDRDDILLVNNAAADFASFPFEPAVILPRCPWCGGTGSHNSWCYSVASPPISPLAVA